VGLVVGNEVGLVVGDVDALGEELLDDAVEVLVAAAL